MSVSSLEIPDWEQKKFMPEFYFALSKLTTFTTGTEKYILLMLVLFSRLGWRQMWKFKLILVHLDKRGEKRKEKIKKY